MIYLGSVLILAISFVLVSFLKVGLGVSWLKSSLVFLGLTVVIMLVDGLAAEELTLFLSVFLGLPIASSTFETIVSYLGIAKRQSGKAWANEMKYKRIILSMVCFLAFFVFKYTDYLPLSLEYLSLKNFIGDFNFLGRVLIHFVKSIDKLIVFLLLFYGLLTIETIMHYARTKQVAYKVTKGDTLVFLIPLLLMILPPLGLNASVNGHFQTVVEENLAKAGIKKGSYELSFYKPYDLRTKEKRIEVNYWTDGTKTSSPYQKTYSYKNHQVTLLKKKEVSNETP